MFFFQHTSYLRGVKFQSLQGDDLKDYFFLWHAPDLYAKTSLVGWSGTTIHQHRRAQVEPPSNTKIVKLCSNAMEAKAE